MLILGEVHTGLLQNSLPLSAPRCGHILALFRGETVRRFARPIAHTASPDLLTGVDCSLPTRSGARVRGVGTVIHRAAITGGHVLQGSAVAHVTSGPASHRLPWSHYLARPGFVETIGKVDWSDLADGHATAHSAVPTLNLGAISGRVMDRIQASPDLDRSPPFRTARTRLRWAAFTTDPSGPAVDERVGFRIEGEHLRTLRLSCSAGQAAEVAAWCEDLALHDWLLTTLLDLIERSHIGTGAWSQLANRLRPAIDHLLHLWMPGARVDQELLQLWECVERRPGFSRQWQASVNRIRDQIAINTMALLGAGAGGKPK